MTGVKDFGRYFEEFVMDYLKVVRKIDLVEMEYPYTIHKEDYKERRSAESYPGDIDVIGLKDGEVWVIECEEALTKSENDIDKMKKKFRAIKNEVIDKKFPKKTVKYFIAYITKGENILKEDFKDEEFLANLEFLDFKDMLVELIKKTKKQTNSTTNGRYNWFFERLKRAKFNSKGNILEKLISHLT